MDWRHVLTLDITMNVIIKFKLNLVFQGNILKEIFRILQLHMFPEYTQLHLPIAQKTQINKTGDLHEKSVSVGSNKHPYSAIIC